MFRKLPGVKKPESPVVWIFGLFILYLSKKIERRRNAVLTKTKGFYDSGIIICGADRFVNLPAHKKLKKCRNNFTSEIVITFEQLIIFKEILFLWHANKKQIF